LLDLESKKNTLEDTYSTYSTSFENKAQEDQKSIQRLQKEIRHLVSTYTTTNMINLQHKLAESDTRLKDLTKTFWEIKKQEQEFLREKTQLVKKLEFANSDREVYYGYMIESRDNEKSLRDEYLNTNRRIRMKKYQDASSHYAAMLSHFRTGLASNSEPHFFGAYNKNDATGYLLLATYKIHNTRHLNVQAADIGMSEQNLKKRDDLYIVDEMVALEWPTSVYPNCIQDFNNRSVFDILDKITISFPFDTVSDSVLLETHAANIVHKIVGKLITWDMYAILRLMRLIHELAMT
jgi:hypothetical protein